MEHHLKIVASNFQLDEKKLTEFALKNKSRYGIVNNKGFVTTTTLFTQRLVDDFQSTEWWSGLSSLRKTQICDTNTEIVGKVRRYETLTGAEIQSLWKVERH